mmetsp:Transcript_25440/g.87748  ORF Transcript_25440/g.87748 Transcript_25440/m.87748 type:complete len:205 (+) Transcript_25440:375-989(+)
MRRGRMQRVECKGSNAKSRIAPRFEAIRRGARFRSERHSNCSKTGPIIGPQGPAASAPSITRVGKEGPFTTPEKAIGKSAATTRATRQFNSTVKRYQLASKLAPVADKPEDASIDLHALRSNPVLSRLLVSLGRAKREVECAASTAPKAGDAVDALWKSGLRMWPARIHVAHGDGTFDVVYADGHAWIKAPRSAIRSKPNKPAD